MEQAKPLVQMEQQTAKELLDFKLFHIRQAIQEVLDKWGEDNSDDFIRKARTGELENSEMDAIAVRQLRSNFDRFTSIQSSIDQGNE